jgi:uncharacterized protein (DUF58 family)
MMAIPGLPLLLGLALLLALAVAASIEPALDRALLAFAAALLGLAALDLALLWRSAPPVFRRRLPHALALGAGTEVTLELDNHGARSQRLAVFDHVPDGFAYDDLPQSLRLGAGQQARLRYRVRALERGEHDFAPCELRQGSPFGLWERRLRLGEGARVRVYPNFAALTRFALLATDHRLSQLGILQRRRRGEGLDFHQLREYREGDAQRQIDWKASARMRRLISREYRDERDQQILLLLDCGRRVAAKDGPLSHLDHALNAALLLGFVALRQGDAVGLMTLGGSPRWVAPRKSQVALNGLMAASFDLQPSLSSPDFHRAAVELMRRLRKRALVVLLSNLRDEDDDDLRSAVGLLRQRHRVVVASLREPILDAALRAPVDGLPQALTHAATADYLERRRRAFARLALGDVPCLDVEPEQLPLALVNRYIELKRAGRM